MIADDHAYVQRLFEHLEAGRGDRALLVEKVGYLLALHASGEEQEVYPGFDHGAPGDPAEKQAVHEHADMKDQLVILDRHQPGDPEFEQALVRLMADVRAHVPHEETDWLVALRSSVGDAGMLELGEKFLAAKRKAPTHAHPHAPDRGIAEKIAGAPAALLDKARDLAGGLLGRVATDPSGLLDPESQSWVDALAALHITPIEILEPTQARKQPTAKDAVLKVLKDRGESTDPQPVDSVEDLSIDGPDGDPLPLRVYRPAVPSGEAVPTIVYAHGGGWVIASVDVYDATPRALVNAANAVVVSVEYRLAPESPFPAAHDDVLAAYRWVLEHIAELGGDSTAVALVGESAGGNLAAATCLSLAAAGEPLPAATALVYPVTSADVHWGSYDDSADAVPLNTGMLGWFVHHATSGSTPPDWRLDLMSVPETRLAALPPTYVVLAERDPLRDQGLAFAEKLESAGVNVIAKLYTGVPHEFFGTGAVSEKARIAVADVAAHLTSVFGGGSAATA